MKVANKVNDILDNKETLMINAFSFCSDMKKEDFAKLMENIAEKGKELEKKAKSILHDEYKKKNIKTAKSDLNKLLKEDDLPLNLYTDIMFYVLEQRRK
jgi:hypothetical protein|tara:strand:+ start:10171 stop:10467 length:297 start_codon:yes stop_codon:yes gene_type:complete